MVTDEEEIEFVASSRRYVLDYLKRFNVKHGGLPSEPAWLLAPYVAVWPIISGMSASATGWFAITGDLPTDYVSSADVPDARSALRHFSKLWREIANCMEKGVAHPDCRIGTPEQWPELHPMLRSRASLLGEFAENAELWEPPPFE